MTTTYDLEERTQLFAASSRDFVRQLPKDLTNLEYSRQLIRASASIGANYIEANEAIGKKDFLMRIKISRKEAKESRYWLRLITPAKSQQAELERLIQEATELLKILSTIVTKTEAGR